jgi:lipopolysaccharide export system protein LptA
MALATDKNQPIEILANYTEMNDATGVAVFSGNVIINQGSMVIEAEHIEALFNDDGMLSFKATNQGEEALVHMQQALHDTTVPLKAWGRNIHYDLANNKLTIDGLAKLTQHKGVFEGGRIMYQIDSQFLQAQSSEEPKRRVDIWLAPLAD